MSQLMCRESGRRIEPGTRIHILITGNGEQIGTLSHLTIDKIPRKEIRVARARGDAGVNIFGGSCEKRGAKLYYVENLKRRGFHFSLSRRAAEKYLPNATKGIFPSYEPAQEAAEPVREARGDLAHAL